MSEPELPEAASLRQAAARLSRLRLAGGALQGETRERLVTLLREAALTRAVATGVPATSGAAEILGEPSDEPRLRMLLERSYRALARQADRPETHAALIDLANQVRPRTLR